MQQIESCGPGLPLMVFRDIREHGRDIFGSFSGKTFIYYEAGVILDPFGKW